MSRSPSVSILKYYSKQDLMPILQRLSAMSPGTSSVLSHHSESKQSFDNVNFLRPSTSLSDCFARMEGFSRKQLITMCKDFYEIGPDHQSAVMTAIKHSEEQREATRASIVIDMDPDTVSRVEKVETAIGYRFRDPRRVAQALTHPSYLGSSRTTSSFPLLKFVGVGFIKAVEDFHLNGPLSSLNEGKGEQYNFPVAITDKIRKASMSGEFLARVAARLGLWENSLHRLPTAIHDKVRLFEDSVERGEFSVRPPKVLGDFTGALGASVHNDCGSFEVFYLIWLKNLFLQDNPVFVLYDRYRAEAIFPSLARKNGVWVVKHLGNILGSGNTIMEAADAANKVKQ